jgi:hypothetical protein
MFANTATRVKSELLMWTIRKPHTFRRRTSSKILPFRSMAKLKFDLPAPLDSAETYNRVKKFMSGDNDFKKFDPKVSFNFDDPSKKCKIKGSQFEAELCIQAKDAQNSQIAIEVEVPMALALFKGKIKEILEKNLKKIL